MRLSSNKIFFFFNSSHWKRGTSIDYCCDSFYKIILQMTVENVCRPFGIILKQFAVKQCILQMTVKQIVNLCFLQFAL